MAPSIEDLRSAAVLRRNAAHVQRFQEAAARAAGDATAADAWGTCAERSEAEAEIFEAAAGDRLAGRT